MKWERLKDNRCPECNSVLIFSDFNMFRCSLCNFKIKEIRFNEIMSSLSRQNTFNEEEENQAALNNL